MEVAAHSEPSTTTQTLLSGYSFRSLLYQPAMANRSNCLRCSQVDEDYFFSNDPSLIIIYVWTTTILIH